MKRMLAFLVLVWFGIGFCHAGIDNTNSLPGGIGDAAGGMLSRMRGEVAGEIRRKMDAGSVTGKDLEDLLHKLSAVSNAVAAAGLNQKIEVAIRQLEKTQTEASAALKNPDSKALLQFDVQPLLLKLEWLKAQNDVLQRQLSDLASTLLEVSAWSKIMTQVMPQDQITSKIKARLNQLANQWEQGGAESGRPAGQRDVVAEARGMKGATLQGEIPAAEDVGSSGNLSTGALEVARMVRVGKTEKEILRYVARSKEPFALTAGQIIYLRREGVPNALIVSMLSRDQEVAVSVVGASAGNTRSVARSKP
jgi:hypothetical protein